ncbi:hypothetical protein DFR70_102818 [Nocardia tenerifensis]|uniref:Uncharacterized protein n=1 Tax=Nocardia tenerifensis TaxID=228006 RepID=A0A318KWJ4_9NOCA|nr:hypothetical protein [Nocardia tenerifensis]PXX69131.1 hypothetical protein DFR70_102818 [Nocardia tenerifensis]
MLFDIRTIVGALLGCYAVVLIITGLVSNSAADEAKTGGVNINLWAGAGMGVVSVLFIAWVLLRPIALPEKSPAADLPDEPSETP